MMLAVACAWLPTRQRHMVMSRLGSIGGGPYASVYTAEATCSARRRYPGRKEEQWWLVLGDTKANTLLAIKRVKLGRASNATLSFVAPATPGPARLMLYFMCDSYMGADQEYEARLLSALIHTPTLTGLPS